jgi:uncharacterized protein (TIGR03435 family)
MGIATAVIAMLVVTSGRSQIGASPQAAETSGATGRFTFEVASVRPNTSGAVEMSMSRPAPARFSATNVPLRSLILSAFAIRPFQLIDAPAWTASTRYDIAAQAEEPPTPEQFRGMIVSLLEDRFALVAKRQTRELPVYQVVVDNGQKGHKLTPSTLTKCPPVTPGPQPPPPPDAVPCGNFKMAQGEIAGRHVTVGLLATALAGFVSREVIDRSGVTGEFDIALQFAPTNVDSSGTSIFTAIQEQLGLKLQPANGPVDVVVVERVERATEN